jgi:ATP-dependent RNA helicase RhlE
LADLSFDEATTIQHRAFSPIMSGRDVLGIAQTGTGKTIAYLLPLLRSWKFTKERHPQVLILVPTRELVIQVEAEAKSLTKYMNCVVVGVFGGVNMKPQADLLGNGCDVVVATPGRLMDLVLNGHLKLKGIKKFVIDEMDEMLNLGFRTQIINVIDLLPPKRQNLMFSATSTEMVEEIIVQFFNDPIRIEAAPVGSPLQSIEQLAYAVPNFNTKINFLIHLLKDKPVFNKVLIFVSTKNMADIVFDRIAEQFPIQIGVIHSNKDQNFRFNAVNSFKNGVFRCLIATDIIARGIDIDDVSHVINFDMPEEPEHYIHRIGRTGRADRNGIAISMFVPNEEEKLLAAEVLMQYEVPKLTIPDSIEISDLLIEEEMPKFKNKNIEVKIAISGPAFHDKKEKNMKTNQKKDRKVFASKKKVKRKK